MFAYIICSNDSIEAVVVDNARKARTRLRELARKDYLKHKKTFKTRKAYNDFAYWHIHTLRCD